MNKLHGVYVVYDQSGDEMYVGSTSLPLEKLEWNHRNYFKFPDGYESAFRKALRYEGADWFFDWIQEPRNISRRQCEIEEGTLIRYIKPKYNKDRFPFETSVRKGRMERV